ncbi:YidC/Oxa1 family membrane protein insertase [Candidatus Peregrinibacteria bacterium]|nr:YidC/Oxa1 family membrane protein insertase [Candidatus Peregrinibacteria bacterium]
MDKLSKFLKNTLVFLAIFLAINYLLNTFVNNDDEIALNSGNVLFTTTDTEYSRRQTVTVQIKNGTKDDLVIKNECPNEPFKVERLENNEWVEKTVTPDGLDCEGLGDLTLKTNEEKLIPYKNWNFALFKDMGIYRISYTTTVNDEEKTFTTNQFTVTKEGVFRQLWLGVFYKPIYNTLIFLAKVLPGHNLGLAIIILTLIIRTILLIPSQKSMKSQARMQSLQPKLEKIKEKYKGDQQKIAAETMAAWKEAKVNPMGSCMPLLMQFPFLIAIFYVVQDGLNPDTTNLLYTNYANFTLKNIGTYFLGLDLLRPNLYVLPLIVGALQFIQMKLAMHKANKHKKDDGAKKNEMAIASNMMIYIMPVMIAVFTASLPAGVGIYWGASTIYGIVQQIFVNKQTHGHEETSSVRVITKKS